MKRSFTVLVVGEECFKFKRYIDHSLLMETHRYRMSNTHPEQRLLVGIFGVPIKPSVFYRTFLLRSSTTPNVILELRKDQVCKGFTIDEILLEGLNIPASQQKKQFRVLPSSVDKILSMTKLDHFMGSAFRFEES